MMIAGGSVGGQALGSTMPGDMTVGDPWPGAPINVLVNNVSWRQFVQPNSLRITDTLGQQVTARLVIVNPATSPTVGDQVKAVFYSETIFSGTILRIRERVNNTGTARYYECDCADHTHILNRRKITRNFTDRDLVGIVDALLDNELSGEGLTLGTLDRKVTIPLLDAAGAPALDLLREAAAATGQAFYVGFDKTLNFVSTSNPSLPVDLVVGNVEEATLVRDLDSYRNKQVVRVKGTPLSAAASDALEVTESRQNDDQIAARAAIEGGTGLHEAVENITHPTSNAQADLQLLGIAYARLRLSTSGTPRSILKARMRGYGFRAGQVGTVTLAPLGITGEWLIQRVTITEQDGRKLVHELELVQSSLQWRAYLSWLSIVRTGKVTVLPPTAITNNLVTFDTPGSTTWTVPAGVTQIEITCRGGSGGGGGNWRYSVFVGRSLVCSGIAYGGIGGNSGLAVTTLDVVEGQELSLTIGAAGVAGNNGSSSVQCGSATATSGTDGTMSQVSLNGVVVCQGNAGTGGTCATGNDLNGVAGSNGSDGSGIGDAVTVGGGGEGGAQNEAGADGSIEIRY